LLEGLEAVLIVGIALGVLRKMRREELNPAVWRLSSLPMHGTLGSFCRTNPSTGKC
jgi:high-affinity Fe2+/Pb2+ permease